MALDTGARSRRDTADSVHSESSASSRASDNAQQQSPRQSKSNSISSLRDENIDDRRPPRKSSPTRSETSNATSAWESGEHATIDQMSPELLAQITEKIKQEVYIGVIEHLTRSGANDAAIELPTTASMQRSSSDKTSSTSSPPPSARLHTPPSPLQGMRRIVAISPPLSPVHSPVSPVKEKPTVRFTNRGSFGSVDKDGTRAIRPAPQLDSSCAELSAVDQKWGLLFDNERNPTARLGQVLRGLANHIIEEFKPKKSIVVTPDKMAAYYASHGIEREIYPLITIFKSQSYELISQLYQDLDCQHHLVQEDNSKAPTVPGLTPVGFANWMTTWILAYPDHEAARLDKVVVSMPIDADSTVDGKPERLPKQISRHLLPSKEDPDARQALGGAIKGFFDDLGLLNRRRPSVTTPPISRRTSGAQAQARPMDMPQSKNPSNSGERERTPYGTTPPDATIVEDTVKIERERKPYIAQPGSGKVHTGNLGVPTPNRATRANSASRVLKELEPEVPPKHTRRQSTATNNYVTRPRPGAANRRAPSPPFRGFSQSTPLNLDINATFNPPSSPPKSSGLPHLRGPPLPSGDSFERARDRENYEHRRWDRRSIGDDPRLGENSTRDAARHDKLYEDRLHEPKSAEPRLEDEDFYRGHRRAY